jgi:hypothetical protein
MKGGEKMKLTEITNKVKGADLMKVGEVLLVGVVMALPFVALAAGSVLPAGGCNQLNGMNCASVISVGGIIIIVLNWFLGIAGLIAVLFLVWGGFKMIVSNGNEETFKEGRTTVINALIGLAVVILAYVVVTIVANTTSTVGS